jgi:class 3 adenylate cyclase
MFAAVLYGYLANPPVAIIAYPISVAITLFLLNYYNGPTYNNGEVLIIQFPAYFMVILMGLIQSFIRRTNSRANTERNRSESLLQSILPIAIIEQLKVKEGTIAERFDNTSILFADIVNFTPMAEKIKPEKLLDFLNEIFTIFDGLTEKFEVEKIKTIGDAYMVVCGTPIPNRRHAEVIAAMALEMISQIDKYNRLHQTNIAIRIGINSGPVIAGVIGKKKFAYDIWGDTVNTASRMESSGLPGKIHISEATYELINKRFLASPRAEIDIKGKGKMKTYFLEGKIKEKF